VQDAKSNSSGPGAEGSDWMVSVCMLRAVLEGDTYDVVAQRFNLTRTAVERRIKKVSLRAAMVSGIEGLNAEGATFVRRLRIHREAVLQAVAMIEPPGPAVRRDYRILSEEEVVKGSLRIRAQSPNPLEDVALYLMLFATGARPLEIARLEVRDWLQADGSVRRASSMRAETAITGKARPMFFRSARLDEAMDAYLAERLAKGQGRGDEAQFRGLDPYSQLFVSSTGRGFEITPYGGPGQKRFRCRGMQETYRKLFRYAGFKHMSTLSVRHTVADRLYARGADEMQIGLLFGISDRSAVRLLFPRRCTSLETLTQELV
jgi:integrase